jgi:hypothetical protein
MTRARIRRTGGTGSDPIPARGTKRGTGSDPVPVLVVVALACLVMMLPGCSSGAKKSQPLLPSEKRLEGMYAGCKVIEVTDGQAKKSIDTTKLPALTPVEFDAVLKRANGMRITNHWKGASLNSVFDSIGVTGPYKELKMTAWDGYVGRVSYDIASKPDTILAYQQDGKPVPRDDGPVRLVVASQEGFYWVRMITKIEVVR